uniref:LRRCT domain-containing protein n=1 Tax=Anopheles farauti TaxID=69004 RepID=A0A182QMV3_9DIPT
MTDRLYACLVIAQLIAIGYGAEIMTAGVAGGGTPTSGGPTVPVPSSSQPAAAPSKNYQSPSSGTPRFPSSSLSRSTTTPTVITTEATTVSSNSSNRTKDDISQDAVDAFGTAWTARKFVNKPTYDRKSAFGKRFEGALRPRLRVLGDWRCPSVAGGDNLECSCDLPHTLRCSGDLHGLEVIADSLRRTPFQVSLLDCTLKNVTSITEASIFQNVSLQGLVISSGEIKRVHRLAFAGIRNPLQALGLPNNALESVPMQALGAVGQLDRLDLSFNKIKALQSGDFLAVPKLSYLELSSNQISLIAPKSLVPLKSLLHLKLNGNRLGESPESLKALAACLSLKELHLHSNGIRGPLRNTTLPRIRGLEILYLDKNSIASIHNGALEAYPYLQMLSLRSNQIDVLQDHAFSGLASLQMLDLGHNGIVTISDASLKHLPRLIILDLTHNFLRALTADVLAPLPALKELRLDGNDISLIAEDALVNATQLHSLSLENNPLVCDCTMRPFLRWLAGARLASQGILGAICATPPVVEGADLLQLAPETLSCGEGNGRGQTDHDTFRTVEVMLKLKNNASYVRDVGGEVRLRSVNFTDESDIFLSWLLATDDYSCRFVYVFHTDDPETILYNSEVSCVVKPEEPVSAMEYTYDAKLLGAYDLDSNVSYKFCLIMKEDISRDEYLGACQVSTLPLPSVNQVRRKSIKKELQIATRQANESDISDFDRISSDFRSDDRNRDELLKGNSGDSGENDEDAGESDRIDRPGPDPVEYDDSSDDDEDDGDGDESVGVLSDHIRDDPDFRQLQLAEAEAARLPSVHGGRVLLEGLGTIIIITSLVAFVWGMVRFKGDNRHLPSMASCYAVDERRRTGGHQEVESRSRYFKLQATTSL